MVSKGKIYGECLVKVLKTDQCKRIRRLRPDAHMEPEVRISINFEHI